MTNKLCIRCKVVLKTTELKDVYQCPMCFTVAELPQDQTIVEYEDKN